LLLRRYFENIEPTNITRSIRQFIAAAFLMTNGHSSGVFLTCIQCYGGGCGGVGNFSIWEPEWNAKVGVAMEEPILNVSTGIWSRKHSTGLTVVNPTNVSEIFFLPKISEENGGGAWYDVYGNKQDKTVTLSPTEPGMVLVVQ
jgi:hypothetical protein